MKVLSNAFAVRYFLFITQVYVLSQLNEQVPMMIEEAVEQRIRGIAAKVVKTERVAELIRRGKTLEELKAILAKEAIREIRPTSLVQSQSADFVRDMGLVYLVSIFESFVEESLVSFFESKPESLIPDGKPVTVQKVVEYKLGGREIGELFREICNEAARDAIGRDIEEVNGFFKRRFGFEIQKFTDWEHFVERFYRRNAIVHSSGKADKIYRSKTGYSGIEERLTVSQGYLSESISMFEDAAEGVMKAFSMKLKLDIPDEVVELRKKVALPIEKDEA
jgi:hypothetical protein